MVGLFVITYKIKYSRRFPLHAVNCEYFWINSPNIETNVIASYTDWRFRGHVMWLKGVFLKTSLFQ